MSIKRILFATGEGIGNVVECAPVLRTIKENLGIEVDFWHAFGSFPIKENIFPYVDYWYYSGEVMNLWPPRYDGKVATVWAQNMMDAVPAVKRLKLLNEVKPLSMYRSEIDTYMDIARDLGVPEDKLIFEAECNYNIVDDHFDIVIANGYNRSGSANWSIKGYPHYGKVVDLLIEHGISVCSVGAKSEYVDGTKDMTGLPLLDSFGVIKNAKCLLANDSGMYHVANALKTPTIVLFTATSIEKNYDSRFHKYTKILGRDDLKCRPCQATRRWNKDCKKWKCQDIDPVYVFNMVMEELN